MNTYKIFRRQSSITGNDQRRRWHVIGTVKATSRPDALRRYGIPVEAREDSKNVVDRSILVSGGWRDCAPGIEDGLYLAWESGTVDFEHYNSLGTFVPATR